MDKETEETIQTYDTFAEAWNKKYGNIKLISQKEDLFLDNLPGKKILDVGSGTGDHAKYFAEKGFDVTGIDLSEKITDVAKKKAPLVKFIKMDLRHLDFPDETFDGVWSAASFLHVPKKEAKSTLHGFKQVLKPNGILYISVKKGEGENMEIKGDWKRFFSYYSEEELRLLMEQTGFEVLHVFSIKKDDIEWISVFAKNKL